MSSLHKLLQQLENHIPNLEKSISKISSSTIGWQIDHCLLVINGIIKQMEISNPLEFQSKFNFPRLIIFTTGVIPRGKANAPKVVCPTEDATAEELKIKLDAAQKSILKWTSLPEKSFFKHPYFGDLSKKKTEKFLVIHTKHHLKIIQDILK